MIRALLALLLLWPAGPAGAQVIRLLSRSAAGSIDPQVNYTAQYWQLFAMAYDGLVAFRKVPGPGGMEVVPDLAEALPAVEGLTYRFRLRPGLRFSDGSAVTPADVVASFRRIFRVGSPTAETFFGTIAGADACLREPGACTLPGVRAEGDTVSITLTRADPEFLQKLALPHASVLPAGAPERDSGTVPVPGTGPYRITRYDPNQSLLMERNPFFRAWSEAAQPPGNPEAIRYDFGLDASAQVTAVLNGQADWMFDSVPPARLPEVAARARLNPAPAILFVPLNTREKPFDDLRARQAFGMAVDRAAALRLFGGPRMATPECRIIPPGLVGHAPGCPVPFDPAGARRLVRQSGTAGQTVTLVVDDAPPSRAIGTWLLDVLADLGYRPRLQVISGNIQFPYIQNTANHVQASLTSWYADFPSAAGIIAGNFGCAAFHPNSDSSTNIPGFCDPALDAQLLRAEALPDPAARGAALAGVDAAIGAQAPAVILLAPQSIDVLSDRIGDYRFHDTFRWLIDQATVR